MLIDNQSPHAKTLIYAFRANAGFSLVSGILMLLFTSHISHWFGALAHSLIIATGSLLIVFALRLAYLTGPGKWLTAETRLVIAGDLGWVATTIVLLTMYFGQISTTGLIVAATVAVMVSLFAAMQYKGLNDYQRQV